MNRLQFRQNFGKAIKGEQSATLQEEPVSPPSALILRNHLIPSLRDMARTRKNPRMLTPRECARLQGFPERFIIPHAKTTSYRQFGNSVAIPVIRKISERIVGLLRDKKEEL